MKKSISLSDFRFMPVSYGRYEVTYTSPVTQKEYTCYTTCMPLIDATKNNDSPKKCDLNALKAMCKIGF
jgi:hypothetical protein